MPTKTEKQTWTAEARRWLGGWRVTCLRRNGKGPWLSPAEVDADVASYFCEEPRPGAAGIRPLLLPTGMTHEESPIDCRALAVHYRPMVRRVTASPRKGTLRLTDKVPVRVYRRPVCRAKDAVRTMGDLCDLYCTEPARLDRAIYKSTDCGASVGVERADGKWVYGTDMGAVPREEQIRAVKFSSIVEGIDATAEGPEVEIPCRRKDVEAALAWVEEEAKRLWEETHGCEACGEVDPESGYTPINPGCGKCHGAGTVF